MAGVELGFLAPHPWIMAAGEREAWEAAELPVRFEAKPEALDHGSMVPILYLNPEGRLPVLLLSAEEGPAATLLSYEGIVGVGSPIVRFEPAA